MISEKIRESINRLEKNINSVVLGKKDVVRFCLVALFSGEHLLLEDVPGVGKTLLGRALARSVSADFKRIQFTPDLIPADITGSNIFNPKKQEFEFIPGPLFSNILLADEINRTTPRTQSAMLEAMNERQVTCDGVSRDLPSIFMVIATENPIEFEGTYPLPESELDRFLMRISIGYPERKEELEILRAHQSEISVNNLKPVLSLEEITDIQKTVREIHISEEIQNYIMDLIEGTRNSTELFIGVSPRGGIAFSKAAQALALLENRDYVTPDDIKRLAVPVLAHRVIARSFGQANQREVLELIIERLLNTTPAPK